MNAPSAWEQFRRELLMEQFGHTTPEYHAPVTGVSVEERFALKHGEQDSVPAERRLRVVA